MFGSHRRQHVACRHRQRPRHGEPERRRLPGIGGARQPRRQRDPIAVPRRDRRHRAVPVAAGNKVGDREPGSARVDVGGNSRRGQGGGKSPAKA